MPRRHSNSDRNKEAEKARAAIERAAKEIAAARGQEEAELAAAVDEAEELDGRDLETGTPLPGRARTIHDLLADDPVAGLRAEVERREAQLEAAYANRKHAGTERAERGADRHIDQLEQELQPLRERLSDYDDAIYFASQPCRSPGCYEDVLSDHAFTTTALCLSCWKAATQP